MDDNTIKALVGVAAAIVGALLAAMANAYAASKKIKEIEIQYAHKLKDGYLENARSKAAEVYIPINLLITQLQKAYDQYRTKLDFENGTVPVGSHNAFLAACRRYLEGIDELIERGADAYLTIEFDNRLRSFNSFLRESLGADDVVKKIVLESEISSIFLPRLAPRLERTTKSSLLNRINVSSMSLSFGGVSLRYVEDILAAPFKSRQFEKTIQTDVAALKLLVKEVILGSHVSTT